MNRRAHGTLVLMILLGMAAPVHAQELTPRAYWPAPVGTDLVVAAYQFTTGDIVTDPSLPVTGVESQISHAQVSYQRTFEGFGRTASVNLSLPYTWGSTEGHVADEYMSRDIVGLGDARARLAINLRGAPAMDGVEFRQLVANPRTLLGASLLLSMPTGGYDTDRVLNAGSNRWAVKPAFGVIWPLTPRWLLEAEAGVWLFADNDEFVGMTREQAPILSTEAHLIRQTRRGTWIALDANFYTGGETTVGGEKRSDLQRNSRFGATVLYPLHPGHSLRGSFSTGVVTRSGGDFQMYSLSYIHAW